MLGNRVDQYQNEQFIKKQEEKTLLNHFNYLTKKKVQKGDNSDFHVGSIDSETLSLGLRSLSAFVSNKIIYLL